MPLLRVVLTSGLQVRFPQIEGIIIFDSWYESCGIINYADAIKKSSADLYVIAIGCNDVRYRNEEKCAMTAEEYVDKIDEMVTLIKESNVDAKIVLLSPWTTLETDRISKLGHDEKELLMDEYSSNLAAYAEEKGFCFIDQNPYLREFFNENNPKLYTNDAIHPNSTIGLELYSKAVLESSK